MNLDDESLLSAYLDDELDPARRLGVEAALLTDVQLAERLQQIAAVRTLVARMSRPLAAQDLSVSVVARIETSPRFRLQRTLRSPNARRRTRLIGTSVLAASLVLMIASMQERPAETGAEPPRNQDQLALVTPKPTPVETDHQSNADAAVTAREGTEPPSLVSVDVPKSPVPEPAASNRESRDRDLVRSLLDQGKVRRLMIIVDAIKSTELEKVEGALQETGRVDPRRAEIRIAQGIEIDPDRPNEAVVYAVVLADDEYATLRDNLRRHSLDDLPGAELAPPSIVTQLADVGEIIVRDVPRTIARSESPAVATTTPAAPPPNPSNDSGPGAEQEQASRLASNDVHPGEGRSRDGGARPGSNGSRRALSEFDGAISVREPGELVRSPHNGQRSRAIARRDEEVAASGVYLVWVTTRSGRAS